MKFKKMHGLGNDFVILDARHEKIELTPERAAAIADRRRGVGCDLIAVLEPAEDADCAVVFYNADGSLSDACGNASRCVADILVHETGCDRVSLRSGAGVLECVRADGGLVTVDMGAPGLEWVQIPLAEARDTLNLGFSGEGVQGGTAVNIGNPHLVFFVEEAAGISVDRLGPSFENNALFPERTNVEFVQVMGEAHLRQRTWERGVGETQACGSGACAVAVAAIRRGLVKGRTVEIDLDGGRLRIEWRESDGHVLMTGPVAYVFDGTLKAL